jgi:hypothetical protein
MTMNSQLPDPLVPADVDLTDFRFMPLEVATLLDSEFMALEDAEAFRAGVVSWCKGWHQVPAASLPDNDATLCKTLGYGRDVKTWVKLRKAGALHGWVLCSDGRLYHPVVAEKALEAWLEKLAQRLSSGAGNAKRWGIEFDAQQINEQITTARTFLARLNPQSKALTKRKPPALPTGESMKIPAEVPTDSNSELPSDDGRQSRQVSRRDTERDSRRDRNRQRQGLDREKGSAGVDESSAGGRPRAGANEGPPPPDNPGQGISAVRRGVLDAFERWFDLPDRPLSPADEELFGTWITAGVEHGLGAEQAVEVIVAEVQRQFRQIAGRPNPRTPQHLRGTLDGDVQAAIRAAKPGKAGALQPVEQAPEPWASHIGATEYRRWIEPCAVAVEGRVAVITPPSKLHGEWVEQRLEQVVRRALGCDEIRMTPPAAKPEAAE